MRPIYFDGNYKFSYDFSQILFTSYNSIGNGLISRYYYKKEKEERNEESYCDNYNFILCCIVDYLSTITA